jgi:anti-sigma B factor antagonist
MKFSKEKKTGLLILHIEGDLIGEDNGAQLVEVAAEAIQEQVLTCVIEIGQLRYINSSGIGVLITILTKFRNKGGEVFLMNPSDSVKKLLVITKLNAIFQTVQSEADALAKLKK